MADWLNALADGTGISFCPASAAHAWKREDLAFVAVAGLSPSRLVLARGPGSEGAVLRNFVASARTFVAAHRPNGWCPFVDEQAASPRT